MNDYIMVVLSESQTIVAKKMAGHRPRYRTFAKFSSQQDAQWATDALNEKHVFEYVTGKDESTEEGKQK